MTVTFVGHKDTPQSIYHSLYEALKILIQTEEVADFYVGHQGAFDRMALRALCELKKIYPFIKTHIVLAYMPCEEEKSPLGCTTLFPEEVAVAPARFAIDRRNRWMIEKSDIIIAYVKRSYGGAAAFRRKAVARGKRIIDL